MVTKSGEEKYIWWGNLSSSFTIQIQSKIFSAPGMSLRAYFSTEFSCGDVFDREESEVSVIDESREPRHKGGMDLHHHAIEFDIEFWPVEHPMEPQDEDRPVKCPMPASSSINDGIGNEERLAAESSRKRSEVTEKLKKGTPVGTEPAVRAVRKRHHTLTRDDHVIKPLVRMPPLPPLPTQNLTIFQMLQEFDKFNS
ncbi:Uncharacterized protein TCM_011218 isoform 1 [Theobroma cacao]|uniref:Uncharacterized protein isoform 1 n=2 Tax=Theobroma cacao TaxID=3641 RepID=A0A061E9H9_THECC|nr:Uncharacterized protein TCM_011218 isoform 1 [Theobroma cacao]